MVFQATQNNPTQLEELSVERDIEADGYVVGFEDAGGSFVEVGRLENVTDNVSQPLEIKHANSGERITLDSSGLKTQKIDDDRLYAGAFAGADADARLANAVSAAADGDVIYLESETYTADLTANTALSLIGTGVEFSDTRITGTTTWTFNDSTRLSGVACPSNDVTLEFNGKSSVLKDSQGFAVTTVTVDANQFRGYGLNNFNVTFEAGTDRCIIDASVLTSVTDNGGVNTVGNIA
jgi:hypothetical protein